MIKTIDDLVDEDTWKSYDQFKPGADIICKQQAKCNLQIWTENDWYDINRVIRHKTNKKIFRVNTHIGCVDVTQDHSLLLINRTQIKPSELKIGVELMHSFPLEFPEVLVEHNENTYNKIHCSICKITKEEAYVWGLFMSTGSCDTSNSKYNSWYINNQNIMYLNQAKEYLSICEPNLKFKQIGRAHV